MNTRLLVVSLVAVLTVGCENPRKKAIERIDVDKEILGKANGAVNEVIRNAADCEVAKPLMAEAYQRLDEARREARLAASQRTLDVLKTQLDRMAQVCP